MTCTHPGSCSICTAAAAEAGRADHRRSVVAPSSGWVRPGLFVWASSWVGVAEGSEGDAASSTKLKPAAVGGEGQVVWLWKLGCDCARRKLGDRRGLSGGGGARVRWVEWPASGGVGGAAGWSEGRGAEELCGWNAKGVWHGSAGGAACWELELELRVGGQRLRGTAVRGRGDARSERSSDTTGRRPLSDGTRGGARLD